MSHDATVPSETDMIGDPAHFIAAWHLQLIEGKTGEKLQNQWPIHLGWGAKFAKSFLKQGVVKHW